MVPRRGAGHRLDDLARRASPRPEPRPAARRRPEGVRQGAHSRRAVRRSRRHLRLEPRSRPRRADARDAAARFAAGAARGARHLRQVARDRVLRQRLGLAGDARHLHARLCRVSDLALRCWTAGCRRGRREHRALTAETPKPQRGKLAALTINPIVVNAAWVKSRIGTPNFHLIDGRAAVYYDGVEAGGPRKGHIKGAKSLPFTEVTDDKLLPAQAGRAEAAVREGGRRRRRYGRRVLSHRAAGDGGAVRRAGDRASGAAVRRIVPGVVAQAPSCRSRIRATARCGAMSAREAVQILDSLRSLGMTSG